MFLMNTRFGKRTGEQAHLQRQEEALFFGHRPMNLKLDSLRLRARIGDGHEQNVNTESRRSASGDSPDDQQRLFPRRDRLGQRGIRRLVRQILFAGKETQKRPPLQRDLIANRPPQHRIAGFKRVKHRTLRNRTLDLDRHLAAGVRQSAQMLREYDADHVIAQCLDVESR